MKVIITQTLAVHGAENLKVGTEHKVVPCPTEYINRYKDDVWVQGENEPIRLHAREYKISDTKDPSHPAYLIEVSEIDVEKLSADVTKNLQSNPKFKGEKYDLRTKLALIDGVTLATDNEACFYVDTHKGMDLDVYRASKEIVNDDGSTGRSISMFPTCGITIELPDLMKYIKRKTNLAEFMGGRFQYNPRIIANTRDLLEYIEKQKALDSGRVKFEPTK